MQYKIIFIISALILATIVAKHMVNFHGAKAASFPKPVIYHDYIFNFIGTSLGWLSLYYLIFYKVGEISITDLLIMFVAFVGITGYLPHIIINRGFKP